MKVEQQKTFTPVTITLETQEEVDMLVSLLSAIGGTGVLRAFSDKMGSLIYNKGDAHRYPTQGLYIQPD